MKLEGPEASRRSKSKKRSPFAGAEGSTAGESLALNDVFPRIEVELEVYKIKSVSMTGTRGGISSIDGTRYCTRQTRITDLLCCRRIIIDGRRNAQRGAAVNALPQ